MANKEERKSLSEVNASVDTKVGQPKWRRFLAFIGPAYLISVGYMDPGNWATDIAGGSKFGYSLIWVLVMSNIIAILLQSHCARLGIVAGKDLAQASRETYPPFINFILYLLAEVAIAACDLAEVVGMAIGLKLLFGLPLIAGIGITVLDTFLLLFLLNFGIRKLEAFIIALVAIIGLSFAAQMFFAQPDVSEIAKGIIPEIKNEEALLIAIGIIGATVMPHNLYLHSSLVQTRSFERTTDEIKKAIRFNFIDSVIALNLALFVNAAILILAASSFYSNGMYEVTRIEDAHRFLTPMVGTGVAAILFAIALIASGQSSTITGTLAGQIIMEGYLNLRLQPWIRRIITRVLAIGPAIACVLFFGESATETLLVLSQVVLSLQLGFAIIPLIHFVSDRTKMGEFAIKPIPKFFSWLSASVIIGLNIRLVYAEMSNAIADSGNPGLLSFVFITLSAFFLYVLFYIILAPILKIKKEAREYESHKNFRGLEITQMKDYGKICICVDFSEADEKAINQAIQLGTKSTEYTLIHIVETPNAFIHGKEAIDLETQQDQAKLKIYEQQLVDAGYIVKTVLGYGNPKKSIPKLINENIPDLLVMGTHGHNTFMDLLLGTTIESVRHATKIPILLVS